MLNKKALSAASAAAQPVYVEDVFSTYIYTGNGSTQTITNGIDLSGEDGMVWIKDRNFAYDHEIYDTSRGAELAISSNLDLGNTTNSTGLTAFTSSGFTIGNSNNVNVNTDKYASWTFRKAPKFFDIVTYTGNGTARTISHNLGSVPGCIIVKRTDSSSDWIVYHRANTANPETDYLRLNLTNATADLDTIWNDTAPTSTVFSVGTNSAVNANSGTYVAYLFAHDAGGFGEDGDQNVISCGSFTADGSGNFSVNLGYEPQWLMFKRTDSTSNWVMIDNIRGWTASGDEQRLLANTSGAETAVANYESLTATGFESLTNSYAAGATYIYIAIRRGPMKTPEAGTEVFNPVVYTGTNADNRLINTSLFTDMVMIKERNDTVDGMVTGDRLRGNPYLLTGTTAVQVNDADSLMTPTASYGNAFAAMNGVGVGNDATSKVNVDTTSNNHVAWAFKRAPGFFDVVTYTGTGSNRTITHNLGVVPELMLVKRFTTTAADWAVYASPIGNTKRLFLNLTDAETTQSTVWNNTTPTSSVFSVGTEGDVNSSGNSFVAYLFASLAGVSKVGSYTGNGTSVTVTTDFQPRFILVKRYDSTGNWVVGDSARGLVAGNDPFIQLDVNAGEITNEDWVDVTSTSFTINETTENLCVNNGTYIYLAIA